MEKSIEGGYIAKALGDSVNTDCYFEVDDMPRIIRVHMVKDETMIL